MAFTFDGSNNLLVNIATGGGSGSNAAAGPTGSPVPSSADYQGVNIGGTLFGVTGLSLGGTTKAPTIAIVDGSGNQITTFGGGTQYADAAASGAHPTGTQIIVWAKGSTTEYAATGRLLTNAQSLDVSIVDGSGNQITSFGGGTQFADNSASGATPTGTLSMGWDSVNSKIRALKVDASQDLFVAFSSAQAVTLASTTVTGTVAVTQSTSPWVVSLASTTITGTVAVTQSTTPWTVQGDSASGAAKAGNPVQIGGVFNTTQPTVTTGQTVEGQYTARGAQIVAVGVDGFAVTVGGTVAVTQSTSPWVVSLTSTTITGTVGVTQSTSPWVVNLTQVAGTTLGSTAVTNFGTAPAAAAVPGMNASLFAGTTGITATGSSLNVNVTNTVPVTLTSTTITGTVAVTQSTSPWVVSLASTTITGTVAVTQSTSPWVDNISQFGGSNVVTGTGVSGAGIPRVTVSSDSFPATQAISAVSLPLPTNAAQETGGNLATIATAEANTILSLNTLNAILGQLKLLNLNLSSSMPGAYVDNDTYLMDSIPTLQ
jgi:hypothetical protein